MGWLGGLVWLQVQLFAVGDAGALTERQVRLYKQHWQAAATEQDILVWLGDNIYPAGLTGSRRSRRRWARVVEVSRRFPGKVYVTPGNHDWKADLPGLQACAQDLPHLPPPGEMGPAWIREGSYLLIFIDSEQYIRKGGQAFLWGRLDSLLAQVPDTVWPVVVLHHPPLTAGLHGGHFPLGAHLFPLRTLSRYLYVPLPGLGSVFIWLRKAARHPTDQAYPAYRALADSLRHRATRSHRPLVFLSGHDHNLQVHRHGQGTFIVSGSGCKTEPVARRRALWAKAQVGYWIGQKDQWEAYALSPRPKLLYRHTLSP